MIRLLDAQVGRRSAAELADTLDSLRIGATEVLGSDLIGVYLTGSFAMGCGDLSSDVDVRVVASRRVSPVQEAGVVGGQAQAAR